MDILSKLFGSTGRIKIMRLFLFNPDTAFENKDIAARSKVSPEQVRREASLLQTIGFIKKKVFIKSRPAASGKKVSRKKVSGYVLNSSFRLLIPLQNLLIHVDPLKKEEIMHRFAHCGRLKLVVLSGVFIQEVDSRVDMLIVGDALRKRVIEHVMRVIEAEIGKELSYAVLDTKEFLYRFGMYDKFVRDIFDYPHEKIVNKLGVF
ncbi:MAG: hypothetical protein HZC03_02450 [Candidatus Lloydbacteria bacterium]|nr:hypothetical protein [Candidatus Lloydbacteria bacterium]